MVNLFNRSFISVSSWLSTLEIAIEVLKRSLASCSFERGSIPICLKISSWLIFLLEVDCFFSGDFLRCC